MQANMQWNDLLTTKRFGQEDYHKKEDDDRSGFQRDFDRLIFSAPFRRLQNKTQVFPLPGSVFVHNRLTHSLEVSSVGRSMGGLVAKSLKEKHKAQPWANKLDEIGAIVSAACLAHDLGNPPFGHSGEKAISSFFAEGNGLQYQSQLNTQQWCDLTHFEGNANALRLLTHQFIGRRKGGFALTYTTLAAIVKYPYASTLAKNKPKFGFFEAEENTFQQIASELGLIRLSPFESNKLKYARHPLVFLVEAADDICYQIMDVEDAHKLKIISFDETIETFLAFFPAERQAKLRNSMGHVSDANEQVAFLRSALIGELIKECARVFVAEEENILRGDRTLPLIADIHPTAAQAYRQCSEMAFKRIYRSADVVDIELAGYQIITALLDKLLTAVNEPDKAYAHILLERIPKQYEVTAPDLYSRILAVVDYVAGMTDVYALDLYRKMYGMSLPSL